MNRILKSSYLWRKYSTSSFLSRQTYLRKDEVQNISKLDSKYQGTALAVTQRGQVRDKSLTESDENDQNLQSKPQKQRSQIAQSIQRIDQFGEDVYIEEDYESMDNLIHAASDGSLHVKNQDIPDYIREAAKIQAEKEYRGVPDKRYHLILKQYVRSVIKPSVVNRSRSKFTIEKIKA